MEPEKPRFVYFDIGGVIYKWRQGLTNLAKTFRIPERNVVEIWQEQDDNMCLGLLTPQEFWRLVEAELNIKSPSDFRFLQFWVDSFIPINETHLLLTELQNSGQDIGLISNIWEGTFPKAISGKKIPQVNFKEAIFSCEVLSIKPETDIFKIAQQRINVPEKRLLLVDDSLINCEAAQMLGWQAYQFNELDPKNSVSQLRKILF